MACNIAGMNCFEPCVGITMKLLLCHSLVRSVIYSAFIEA